MKRGVESFLGSFRTVIKGPLVRSTRQLRLKTSAISMIQWKPVYIVASHKKTSPRQVCGAMCAGPFLWLLMFVKQFMTLNSQPSVRVGFFAMFLNVVDVFYISVNILKAACQCHGVVDAADTSFVRLRRFFNAYKRTLESLTPALRNIPPPIFIGPHI